MEEIGIGLDFVSSDDLEFEIPDMALGAIVLVHWDIANDGRNEKARVRLMNQAVIEFMRMHEPVSYTHLDVYKRQALQSRLAQNTFAAEGLVDFSGPVVRLSSLSPEDLYVLLQKIRGVYAFGDPARHLIPDPGIYSFMEHCSKRIGDTYFRTPRTTITALSLIHI